MGHKTFNDAIDSIDRGKHGLNVGLPHGLPTISEFVPNIQQKTYYLIGASTGCGKTSFVDNNFVYTPYDYILNNETIFDMDITYFSYEIDKVSKIIKGISRYLYLNYNLTVDVNYILSRGKNRISQEVFDLVLKTRVYFEQFEDKVTFFDSSQNPTGMFKYLWKKAEENGKIEYKIVKTKDDLGREIEISVFDRYIPNNPNKYFMFVVDHVALAKEEKNALSTKAIIDKISQYSIMLRNNFNMIPIMIQQLSYEINDPIRAKINRLSPMLSDFGDSKYTTRKCIAA